MSELDSRKRTRSKTKNDDDSLNKPQPKKSRARATKKEIKDENPPETNVSPSLENDNEAEGDSSQAQSPKKWTPEQRLQLIEAVLKHVKVPWDEVCSEVDGGKNGKMCYDQWRRKIVPGLKTFIKSERDH